MVRNVDFGHGINVKEMGMTKRQVWEAYKRVKANKGAAGVDDDRSV